jgi:hypothetical protein
MHQGHHALPQSPEGAPTPAEWLDQARDLAARHAALAPANLAREVRRALAETYQLLDTAPFGIVDDFSDIRPEYLDYCGTEWSFDLLQGKFGWQGTLDDEEAALRAAAGHLRGLDVALHTLVGGHLRPSDPTRAWAVEDLSAFVVPRRRPSRRTLSGAGLSFARNALVHHRVLPAELKGCSLRFEWLDASGHAEEGSWMRPLGAAMFRPFGLVPEPSGPDGEFIVARNDPPPPTRVIDHQLEQAGRDRCFALVWPEVSLPPERQRHVAEILAARSADLERPPLGVDFLVLGSWHETGETGCRNVSRVLNADGEEVFSHVKVMPYRSKRAKPKDDDDAKWLPRREDIVRGNELTVLVTEHQLVAVVICRDLCDRSGRTPFRALDVDLVLVPSLGNERTLHGHGGRAADLQIQFGTQTFVAQHPQNSKQLPAGGYGWVLRPSDCPDQAWARVVQMSAYAPYDQLPPGEAEPMAE